MTYGFGVTFSDEDTEGFPIEASSAEEAWKKLAIELANNCLSGFFERDEDLEVTDIELQHIGPGRTT